MAESAPRVVYWNNIPAPYVVEQFNAVAERANLNFEAWFSARIEPGRSWNVDEASWLFPYRYLPGRELAGHVMAVPTGLFARRAPDLLVTLYADTAFLAGWSLARKRRMRTAFWEMVTFDSWIRRRPWKEAIKRHIFPKADGILTVGQDGRKYARKYGATDERIYHVRPGVDVAHFSNGGRAAESSRRVRREQIGLHGTTFLYVGRLWWGKGLDYLLNAFRDLQERVGKVSLLLVGDGPDEERLRARCRLEGIGNVTFLRFQQKATLPQYYALADAFVFPTLGDPYGHVLDEAMASSLPIITTSAVGEIAQRVNDGVSGFIVPPADSAALLDRMARLASDEGLRHRQAAEARAKIDGHTADRWAIEFEVAVERILSMPRVSAP